MVIVYGFVFVDFEQKKIELGQTTKSNCSKRNKLFTQNLTYELFKEVGPCS